MAKKKKKLDLSSELVFAHFSVCFIDLLGQQEAMKGQQLLPLDQNSPEFAAFSRSARESIGRIMKLQKDADNFVRAASDDRTRLDLSGLTPRQRKDFLLAKGSKIKQQRWSDGLVLFARHADRNVKCPMNSAFALLGTAGCLCLLGLARKAPLRGGIDFAWGAELKENELYGPAVARAYELESSVAQYPRIVVGREYVRYLEVHGANPATTPFAEIDRAMAKQCLSLLVEDADGNYIVHYLGDEFIAAITHTQHAPMYAEAQAFVAKEWERLRKIGDSKLSLRYSYLWSYFEAHRPAEATG